MRFTITSLLAVLVTTVAARGVSYDCAKTPQICLNTCWAIKCAKASATLHGGGQKNAADGRKYNSKNRNKWGYRSKPCDNGWGWNAPNGRASSPDEYPYASSQEAGRANFQKIVSLRCVPIAEQNSQGGTLSGLATDKTSNTWTTTWTNISKLPQDWCGRKPACKNDGHQFISQGSSGPFKLAANPKVVADIASYSEDGNTAWVVAEPDTIGSNGGDVSIDQDQAGETEAETSDDQVAVPFEA